MNSKPPLETRLSTDDSRVISAVGPGAGLAFVETYFPDASTIRIASAYFSLSGYIIGRSYARQNVRFHVLVGREDGTNVRKAVIEEIHAELRSCESNLWDAVADLVGRMRRGDFTIRDARAMSAPFHCKFYICDAALLWHGSANYSRNGLLHNAEQVTLSRTPEEIALFTSWFGLVSSEAKDVLSDLIELLEEWLTLASPFDVYLKVLLSLSRIPDSQLNPGARAPTYYQKAVIARSLRQVDNFGGALIVLATGLGKTVVGAETHVG
jgi:hypothetical protein